jgi:hypothetical protein
MQSGTTTGDTFQVRIMVDSIDDFYGAAFGVTFDPAFVDFLSASGAGSFIAGSGVATNFNAVETTAGVLDVIASRQDHSLPGVDAGATPLLLVTLNFRALAATSGSALDFSSDPADLEVQICPVGGQACTIMNDASVHLPGGTLVVN